MNLAFSTPRTLSYPLPYSPRVLQQAATEPSFLRCIFGKRPSSCRWLENTTLPRVLATCPGMSLCSEHRDCHVLEAHELPVYRRNPLPPAPLVVAACPLLCLPSTPLLSWCHGPYLVSYLRRIRHHWVLSSAWSPLQTPQYSGPRTLRRSATVGRSFTLVRAGSLVFWAVVGRISSSPPSCSWDSQDVK